MHTKRPPIPVIIVIVLVVLSTIGYFVWKSVVQKPVTSLTASGTIEATSSSIAPEISGKVAEVMVSEGDQVIKGETLFVLGSSLLEAQRNQASAALDSAKAGLKTAEAGYDAALVQHEIILQASQAEDEKQRKSDWDEDNPVEFDQPIWYFTRDEKLQHASEVVDAAQAVLQEKTENLKFVESKATSASFLEVEQRLLEARQAFLIAKDVLDSANEALGYDKLKEAAQNKYDDVKDHLYDVQDDYDESLNSDEATDIKEARAELRVAQEIYDTAVDYERRLLTGKASLQLKAAQAALGQAEAVVSQSTAAVNLAQSNLDLLDTQIKLLTITSPMDGVVLSRLIEPGEVINTGVGALTIADINLLHLTVYVSEDRIGEITLGQNAKITVDSFPGQTFSGRVDYISDQAEFTPRNVQTAEGRRNTVFAVRIKIDDASTKLKPGMPADVSFE